MRYIIDMIPYMLISAAIYIFIRIIIAVVMKERKPSWVREIIVFSFVVYCAGVASQTIIPKFEFGNVATSIIGTPDKRINIIPFKVFLEVYKSINEHNYFDYFIYNFLGNIILFIPFGIYLPLIFKKMNGLSKTLLCGFAISITIEIIQFPLHRGSDIDDLWLNTLGVILGFLLYRCCHKFIKAKTHNRL